MGTLPQIRNSGKEKVIPYWKLGMQKQMEKKTARKEEYMGRFRIILNIKQS